MKLNLVPTYVSKERQGRTAIFGAVMLAVLGIVGAVMLTSSSKAALDVAHNENTNSIPPAQAAVDTSNQADTIIASAAQIIKDTNLAQAMIDHNDVFPDFYTNQIIPYIPPFFRINTLSAQPIDGETSVVTMVGTLKSFHQYADLALALMRIPGAVSVGRNGFTGEQFMVPALTPQDQVGKVRKPNDPPIPDDPTERLAYLEAQTPAPTGYLGVGNFGSGTEDPRGATPDESLITIQLTVRKNLQTPDPRATLRTSGAGPAAGPGAAGLTGFGGPGGPPGGPGGPPGMTGPPPSAPAAAPPEAAGAPTGRAGRGKGAGAGDDE
jgi:hypothetical protein